FIFFFFSSRRRHTRSKRDWSSDVCSSDLEPAVQLGGERKARVVGDAAAPVPRLARGRNPVEGRIDFVGVKERGHHRESVEPARRSEERRVGKEWRSGWAGGDEMRR